MVASEADIEQAGASSFTQAQNALFAEGFSFSGYERDHVYLHLGAAAEGDRRYVEISGVSGLDSVTDGRGAVFADFDNDGDTDIFLTTIQGQSQLLFRNQVGAKNRWLRLALTGTRSGTDACATVVRLTASHGTQAKILACGSGYLAQHDARLLFGLGSAGDADTVHVQWPSGMVQTFSGVAAGSYQLTEGGALTPVSNPPAALPDPVDESTRLSARLAVKVGDTMPDVPLTRLDGKTTSLGQALTPGRRTLINLWATYCVPCRREMPELAAHRREFAAQGIELLGVSLDQGALARAAAFLDAHDIDYPNLIAGSGIAEQVYGGEQVFIPLSFLVTDSGRIEEIVAGGSVAATRRLLELASGD